MTSTSNGINKKITIVTHNGHFHADEIFAVATLLLILGEKDDVAVVRTRDMEIIESGDYVVDVGGIYDESKNYFDHHQIGGSGIRSNTIPYASFGLVWKKYGEKLSGSSEVAQKIDQILIQWIDATDNGIQIIETKIPGIYPYDIGLFFNSFTPNWNDSESDTDDIFMQLVSLAKTILIKEISKRKNLLEVRSIVKEIYNNTGDKRLIVFDRFYPSQEILSEYPEPLFTVSPRDYGDWEIKAVRSDKHSFKNRKDLPLSWASKTGEELEKVTGVSGSMFCHKGRFIATAKTKEAILKMAEIALNQ
ncbi:MAG: MYG1 family protein [Candidatus Zambryskibacteria bacterium]|nr:MYG1 family protein [Candidatus Zambryskibacteria bacterium]